MYGVTWYSTLIQSHVIHTDFVKTCNLIGVHAYKESCEKVIRLSDRHLGMRLAFSSGRG